MDNEDILRGGYEQSRFPDSAESIFLAVDHNELHVRPRSVFITTRNRRHLEDLEDRWHIHPDDDVASCTTCSHTRLRFAEQGQQEYCKKEPFHVGMPYTGPLSKACFFEAYFSSMKLLSIQTLPSSFRANVSAFSLVTFFSRMACESGFSYEASSRLWL